MLQRDCRLLTKTVSRLLVAFTASIYDVPPSAVPNPWAVLPVQVVHTKIPKDRPPYTDINRSIALATTDCTYTTP